MPPPPPSTEHVALFTEPKNLVQNEPVASGANKTVCVLLLFTFIMPKNDKYNDASAPAVTGTIFMRRFRLFLDQWRVWGRLTYIRILHIWAELGTCQRQRAKLIGSLRQLPMRWNSGPDSRANVFTAKRQGLFLFQDFLHALQRSKTYRLPVGGVIAWKNKSMMPCCS